MMAKSADHAPRKRATISDVAQRAKVSVATVSNVLNGRFAAMQPETRQRVEEVIAELGYRPSSLARGLRTKRTRVVGLIVPSASNGVFPAIIKGAQDTALQYGFDVFVCSTDRDPAKNRIHVASLLDRHVDGIIFVHSLAPTDPLVATSQAETPVVVFAPGIGPWSVSSVCLDNERAIATLVGYLARLGHRRIAYVDHSLTSNCESRVAAYQHALSHFGIAATPGDLVIEPVALGADEGYEIESGTTIVRRLLTLPDPPTAIIGGNDLIAAGVLNGAKELGFRIPQDLSVVGFDDLAVGRVTDPMLTTMQFAKADMGAQAFRQLIDRQQDDETQPPRAIFQFDLLIRQSTGRLRSAEEGAMAEAGIDDRHGGR